MATKRNPGAYDCYTNAAEDEPMFVLLGRDPMAGILIKLWVQLRQDAGEDPAKLEEAMLCALMCDRYAIGLGKTERIKAAVESLARLRTPVGP